MDINEVNSTRKKQTQNHQEYQTSDAGLDKISYYHLIHHLQNLLIQGQKCDPGHHIRRRTVRKTSLFESQASLSPEKWEAYNKQGQRTLGVPGVSYGLSR